MEQICFGGNMPRQSDLDKLMRKLMDFQLLTRLPKDILLSLTQAVPKPSSQENSWQTSLADFCRASDIQDLVMTPMSAAMNEKVSKAFFCG